MGGVLAGVSFQSLEASTLAALAASSYFNNSLADVGLQGSGWRILSGTNINFDSAGSKTFVDAGGGDWYYESGRSAAQVYQNGNSIVVSFRGTDSTIDFADYPDIIPIVGEVGNNIFGSFLPLVNAVNRYAAQISSPEIAFVGHSLGGAPVNYLAENLDRFYGSDDPVHDARYFTLASPYIGDSPVVANFGFENDWVFNVARDNVENRSSNIFIANSDYNDLLWDDGLPNLIADVVSGESAHEVAGDNGGDLGYVEAVRRVLASPFVNDMSSDTYVFIVDTDERVVWRDVNQFFQFNSPASATSYFLGRHARDEIWAGSGQDIVEGWDGNDLIAGLGGRDLLYGNGDFDRLYGNDGTDTLYGGSGDDWLYGGTGSDDLYGGPGAGNDILFGAWDTPSYRNFGSAAGTFDTAATDRLYGEDGNDILVGGDGADSLWGGAGDDTLAGLWGSDWISAGEGNDFVKAPPGNWEHPSDADTLIGDSGNDTLYGGAGNDSIWGDEFHSFSVNQPDGDDGNDFIAGGGGDDRIKADAGNDTVYGNGGDDYIDVDEGRNEIYGGTGSDELHGSRGDDRLYGLFHINTFIDDSSLSGFDTESSDYLDADAGDDEMFGGTGNDTMIGAAGDDTMQGLWGNDSIDGGAGNDIIAGNFGSNTLIGGAGDDILFSGFGPDRLTGGDGADDFRFREHDTLFILDSITDYNPAEGDRIFTVRDGEIVELRAAMEVLDSSGRTSLVLDGATDLTGMAFAV